MTYKVDIKRSAEKDLEVISEQHRRRIRTAIDELSTNPRHEGSVRLHGGESGYRIRVGDYRVRYTVDDVMRVVRVYRIGNRREVYR